MSLTGYRSWAVTSAGNVVPGAAIRVRRAADDSDAVLFTDATGVTPLSNPFNAEGSGDSNPGSFEFYVDPDRYNILVGSGASQVPIPVDIIDSRENLTFGTLTEYHSWVDGGGAAQDGSVVTVGNATTGFRVQFVADSALVTPITGLRAGWRPYGALYLEHFAVNSGDMSAAINLALAYGSTIKQKVRLRADDYTISSILIYPDNTGLKGAGESNTRLLPTSTGFNNQSQTVNPNDADKSNWLVVEMSGQTVSPFTPAENQSLEDLTIEYTRPSERRFVDAVHCRNSQNFLIKNVSITGFALSRGVKVDTARGVWRIENLRTEDFLNDFEFPGAGPADVNIYGLDFDDNFVNSTNSDPGVVRGLYVDNLRHGAAPTAAYGDQADGLGVQKGGGHKFYDLTIKRVNEGFDVFGSDCKFYGVRMEDNGGFGAKFIHGAQRNEVYGMEILRPGLAGLLFTGGVITDTRDNKVFGLYVEDVDPTGDNAPDFGTACIRLDGQIGGNIARQNLVDGAILDPGTNGEHLVLATDTAVDNVVRNIVKIQDAAVANENYATGGTATIQVDELIKARSIVSHASPQQTLTTGTPQIVAFNNVVSETVPGDHNTTTFRFPTRVPGTYRVTVGVRLSGTASMLIEVNRNGSSVRRISADSASQNHTITSVIEDCTENGTLDVRAATASGTQTVTTGASVTHATFEKI